MALGHSPSIVRNGLVFYYDMNNTKKSWKGKPTTNFVTKNVENYTGWTGAGWWLHPGNTVSVTTQRLPNGELGSVFNATDLGTGGLYGYNGYALNSAYSNGTQYAASFWAKSFNNSTGILYLRDADSGGNLSTSFNLTDRWQRFSVSWTANGVSNMMTFTGSNLSLYQVQLEQNSFATPFVNGTRSNTQAILDLTNNYTITANNLNYNNDNTFNFNGSNSNLDAPPPNVGNFSIDLIAKWTSSLSDVFACGTELMGSGISGGTYIKTHIQSNGMFTDLYSPQVLGGGWKSGNVVSGSFTTNTTYNITIVNSGTIWYYYSNGVYLGSYDHTYLANTGSSRTGIFRNHVQIVGNAGYVYAYKQYNRALAASEVLQNFNAHRGIYGI